MSAIVEVVDGVLNIRGDSDVRNQIRVSARPKAGNLVIIAGAVRRVMPLAGVLAIQVTGGNAADRVLLSKNLPVAATLDGGAGDDQLFGGAFNDTILGGPGNDRLVGRRGDDRLVSGGGQDVFLGGPGANVYDRSDPLIAAAPITAPIPAAEPAPDPGSQPAPAPPPAPDPAPAPIFQPPPLIQPPYPTSVIERPTTLQRFDGSAFTLGRDVRAYRNTDGALVTGDGVHDDTTGIQRAIDSLPKSQGIPQGTIAVGGTVFFPPGTYRITQSLRVPGGVILAGAGPGSVLQYDGDKGAAVEFINQGVDFNSGGGATDLTVRADRAGGFGVRAAKRLHLTQLRFVNIVLDTAGWGINFLAADSGTQNCFFDNVLFRSVGAGGINIRGNANKLNAIRTEGAVRPNFKAKGGVVVVDGAGTSITRSALAGLPADAVGFYLRGSDGIGPAWFTGNTVAPADAAAPAAGDGPGFVFENLEGMYVDDLGGRRARFTNTRGVRIARQWAPNGASSIPQLLDADSKSRILINDVYGPQETAGVNTDQGVFRVLRSRIGTAADYLTARGDPAAALPPSPALTRNAVAIGLNVKEFAGDDGINVRGDGIHDDSPGIQKAINLFLANRADPAAPQSGAVYLPTGIYRITTPLMLPSGVVLIGDGSGTAIRYTGQGGVAVRFSDPSGTVAGAGLENLSISADAGGGVGDVRGVPVVAARMKDLVFNTASWGIDLRDLRDSRIDNIHQKLLGAGSVRIDGPRNLVHAVNTEFGVRRGFNADPALVVVRGDFNTITGSVIEGVPSNSATAMYVSGSGVTFGNNWMEITSNGPLAAKDGIAVVFENLRDARIHDIFLLNSKHRAKFVNSQAKFTIVDTNAEALPLEKLFLTDAASRLTIELAISRHGLGDANPAIEITEQLVLVPRGDGTGAAWVASPSPTRR